jgi:hypothetical protein
MRIVVLFIIALFIVKNLSAQVRGTVADSANKKPITNAFVGMYPGSAKNDTIFTVTNENGQFQFDIIPKENFSVTVSSIGYMTGVKFRRLYGAEKRVNLDTIFLTSKSIMLEEVKIEVPPITIKGDTIEYKADSFKVKENAVIEDLLKKLPGVQVDRDGSIKAQGREITRIKVNGKDFFGGDPLLATRELPANIVDRIQIINDYGDQAAVTGIKQGEPEKTLNIRIKKNKNRGSFGRVNTGIGNEKRYVATVNSNYFSDQKQISVFGTSNNINPSFTTGRGAGSFDNMTGGSIGRSNARLSGGSSSPEGIITTNSVGMNYRDNWGKKLTVYGSYTYSKRTHSGTRITAQQNIFPSETFFNNQTNTFKNLGYNQTLFVNLEYNIDSFNYLKISPTFYRSKSNGNNNTVFDYFITSGKTSDGYYNTISTSNSPSISGTILYNHKFRKPGRDLSFDINTSSTENNSTEDSRNGIIQYSPSINSEFFLFSNQQNNNDNYGIKLTYTEPLVKARFIDVSFGHNFFYSKSNRTVYNVDPVTRARIFSSDLTDSYESNYFHDQLTINLRTSAKKYNYTLGVSAEPVDLRGFSITKNNAYKPVKAVNVFPVASFSYNFSNTRSINFSYRGSAQQPGFAQLQDVIDSSNVQYQTKGNPNLKPSIQNNLNLYYNSFSTSTGRVLFTNVSISTIKNQIVNNIIRIGTSGAQLTTPENVDGYYNVNGFYNYSRPFHNRNGLVSMNGSLNYYHNINLVDNFKNSANNWQAVQGVSFNFNNQNWLEFSAGVNYSLNSITYSDAGINSSPHNSKYSTWNYNGNVTIEIPWALIVRCDLDYLVNDGLTAGIARNVANLNTSIEKQLLHNKGLIRFQGLGLLNQNSNITRIISANSIIDSRTTKLNRYFLVSFAYRIQRFKK